MDISYLACGKCNEFLRVVSPRNDFTADIMNSGGKIDSAIIFLCPHVFDDLDGGHTRIILDMAKIIKTGWIENEDRPRGFE